MTRHEQFVSLFPHEKSFRWRQVERAIFDVRWKQWSDCTTFSLSMREMLEKEMPWISIVSFQIFTSVKKDTHKAILTFADGKRIETVLMKNKRDQWTICVSSQVGCAMKCGFCATGKMGLIRNLSQDEIVDQYRFWKYFLAERKKLSQRISNIVFMGMGEPLANYENVKHAIKIMLSYTDLGPTHITVSTVGVFSFLEKILKDPDWPHVRLAVSLHSADAKIRKAIVPTSSDQFIKKFQEWATMYLKQFGNRRHHLTLEYVMLCDVNDTERHAKMLADLVRSLGNIKVNLIPYNYTHLKFSRSLDKNIESFKKYLETRGVEVMIRKTMGDDIAAACGQLIVKEGEDSARVF